MSTETPNGWDFQIATSELDGSKLKVLTASDTQKQHTKFSFDGGKIVFEGKERCKRDRNKYCAADLYELDIKSGQERRLTDLQALSIGSASYLPGNERIIFTAYGSVYSRAKGYESRIEIERLYGDRQRVFTLLPSQPDQFLPVLTGTETANSPQALQNGEVAFLSRVNKIDDVKGNYIYDIFITGDKGTRRLTNFRRYVRGFGISGSGKSAVFVTEGTGKPANAELWLWKANQSPSKLLRCDRSVDNRPLN